MIKNVIPVVIASGLQSPEGPSFNRDGVLHFVDWDAQIIYRLTINGKLTPFVKTGGLPTGSKFHRDGRLFVTDGNRGVLVISPDGTIQVAVSHYMNQPFQAPNDLVFAFNGDLYFSDPKDLDEKPPVGNIFILRNNGRVEKFASGFRFPNGIALSEDGSTLYLAETFANNILAFELDENGHEKSRRIFARLEGGLGPDGMAFGKDGNLYVAHYGKGVIAVVNPSGNIIAELQVGGQNPTNVAFWENRLYITEVENHQIVCLDIGVCGQILFGLT